PALRLAFVGHTGEVQCVAVSRDGKTVASGGADNTIRFWDVASGKERAAIKQAAEHWVDSVAFSPDGKTLAAGTGGNALKLWDVAAGKSTATRKLNGGIQAAAISPDGKKVATAVRVVESVNGMNVYAENCVKVWEPATGKAQATLPAVDVLSVVFSPDA